MASTSGKPSGSSKLYPYLTVRQAYEEILKGDSSGPGGGGGRRTYVNAYAIVVECSNARPTKGTDKIINIRLADATTTELGYSCGVELLCFAAKESMLPNPKPGDIMRLHRVGAGLWNDNLQFMGKVGGSSPFQYLLFEGNGADYTAYKSSSTNFHFGDEDLQMLKTLRRSSGDVLSKDASKTTGEGNPTNSAQDSTKYLKRIDELNSETRQMSASGSTFDILCKVLYVGEGTMDAAANRGENGDNEESSSGLVIRVWDGTDVNPSTIMTDESEFFQSIYPDCWNFISNRTELIKDMVMKLDPLAVETRYGTALPIKVLPNMEEGLKGIRAGQWVIFRQLRTMIIQGQLQGLYTETSRWCSQASDKDLISKAQEKAQANIVSRWAPSSSAALANLKTKTKHSKKQFTTLRQIRSEAITGRPNKYRVLATMVGYFPTDFKDFCKVQKKNDGTKKHVFSIKIRLEDSTGDLDAILWGSDAEELLKAKACDLNKEENQDVLNSLNDRFFSYMGFDDEEEGADKVEWLDLCIFSYFMDPNNPLDTCHYRVFDSRSNF